MTGKEIALAQMLARRERRVQEQEAFLKKYNSPLISFSMNIPGPVKTNGLIRKAFDTGKNLLLNSLNDNGVIINECVEIHEDTGDEMLLSVKNIAPDSLKGLMVDIENTADLGRLFDIDVIDVDGHKLSRKTFRTCLICDKQAQECARSRTHSVKEMQDAVEKIIILAQCHNKPDNSCC